MRTRTILLALTSMVCAAACSAAPPVEQTAYRAAPAPSAPSTTVAAPTSPLIPTPSPVPVATPQATRTPEPTTPAPTTRVAAAPAPAGRALTAEITFYAAGDNDPAGSTQIAFPGTRHDSAGGTGTYDDPVTLASDPDHLDVGTIVYHPGLRKYFVMEDICAQCTSDWSGAGRPHIDLWTGDDEGSDITACEHALTPSGPVTVELDAPRGRPVDGTPLYKDGSCAAG